MIDYSGESANQFVDCEDCGQLMCAADGSVCDDCLAEEEAANA